jgi:fatty-acyl-CoA synthase
MRWEDYLAQLTAICEQTQPRLLVVDASWSDALAPHLAHLCPTCSWQDLTDSGAVDECPPGDDDPAYIQYSSGTTGVPKGCVLTAGAIARQISMLLEFIGVRCGGGEVVNSWLPLSHDMGMFGTLLSSWYSDNDLYMSRPERFIAAPRTWFGDIASHGVTITAGTNTGVYLSARGFRATRGPEGRIDLRACIVGAERVDWNTLDYAVDVLGEYGLTAGQFMPAYGLAEATLAVTAVPCAERPRRLCLDAIALADGDVVEVEPDAESATSIVTAGRPLPGVVLAEHAGSAVDRIRFRSPSAAAGYWGAPELTADCFRDGEVHTNDLGFVADGLLYLVGRCDDMINVAGRNVYARAVEEAIDSIAGVRRGCCALLERSGEGGALTLLLELDSAADHHDIARAAADAAMAKAAVALDECLVLDRGSLPKTPSGKVQRYRCRQLLARGELTPRAVVDLARTAP